MPSMCGRTGRHVLLVFLTVATVMLLPGRASATVYTWAHGNNGDWTKPASWFCDGTTGSCANGFPNGRGDQANFITNPSNISVVVDRPVRIGSILLSGTAIQFVAFGAGQLIFDNGDAPASIVRNVPVVSAASTMFLVPMELQSQLTISTGAQDLHLQTIISGTAGITVDGQSRVFFSASALFPNTYQGRTFVTSGTVTLGDVG